MFVKLFFFYIFLFQFNIKQINSETVHGCTINNNNNNNRRLSTLNKTSVTLSCPNNGFILVRNLTFGVHKTTKSLSCSYEPGDCTTRTTYIGMECNGLKKCNLDLNPQYLHICSQYSDYMVLDYSCLQGQSLSICDNDSILTSPINMKHRLFIRSPNYPNEYENSLNCSCKIETKQSMIEFLDFYLEERDEMNYCTRDYLQIGNQSYCDSKIEQNDLLLSSLIYNSSIDLIFKTNDVITRKGFWLMFQSEQSMKISCRDSFDSPYPIISTLKPITVRPKTLPVTSLITTSDSSPSSSTHRRYTLSFILILIIIFVIVLLFLNLILIILCWKQKRSKQNMNSKSNSTHQPFFCAKRLSTSSCSSITYGDTPVFTSIDGQKQQTTSTTTATTGAYEDPNELLTLQRQQKIDPHQSVYIPHRFEPKGFCPIVLPSCPHNTGYNRMIHFPAAPVHCHLNSSGQTFYPLHSHYQLDSQHIYETIQDGQCPYQRLAATLRRQQHKCTCSSIHNDQILPARTEDHEKNVNIELNPETLV